MMLTCFLSSANLIMERRFVVVKAIPRVVQKEFMKCTKEPGGQSDIVFTFTLLWCKINAALTFRLQVAFQKGLLMGTIVTSCIPIHFLFLPQRHSQETYIIIVSSR